MNRTGWLWLAGVVLLVGGCSIGTPAEVAGLDYISHTHRFAMNVPPGWTVREGSGMPTMFALGPEGEKGFRPNVNVVVEAIKPGTPLAEYAAFKKSQLQALRDYELISEEERDLADGRTGHIITFRQAALEAPVIQRQLYVVAGGRGYAVTATAPEDRFSEEEAHFEICFQSFRAGW